MADSKNRGVKRKRAPRGSLTAADKKENKRIINRKYNQKRSDSIRTGVKLYGQFTRWSDFKTTNRVVDDEQAAQMLLDHYERYERQTFIPVIPSPSTQHKRSQPSTSTPASFQPEMQVLISEGNVASSPMVSVVERLSDTSEESLLTRYERKTRDKDSSFLKITVEESVEVNPNYLFNSEGGSKDSQSVIIPRDIKPMDSVNYGDQKFNISSPKDDTNIVTEAEKDKEVNNYVLERKAICFESKVLELARLNVSKVCPLVQCRADVSISTKYVGSATQLTWVCSKGHVIKIWNSQPVIKQVYVGDLLLSSAILKVIGNDFK